LIANFKAIHNRWSLLVPMLGSLVDGPQAFPDRAIVVHAPLIRSRITCARRPNSLLGTDDLTRLISINCKLTAEITSEMPATSRQTLDK
jgi:hypothetical protein